MSGGVDSSVVAALLIKAIGQQLVCVHVNHGLMRKNESESVVQVFRDQLHANLVYVDASERFLGKLENVADPEEKEKSSVENLSAYLKKKQESWKESNSLDRELFIRISSRAEQRQLNA